MKNYVIENYENYCEENRLTTNNARRIEFITTSRIMDELISSDMKVLDCAAGTGIYAFHLADRNVDVTATDITPRHVKIMDEIVKSKSYDMKTAVMDATDMSRFDDETFDVVLNMGSFYHLISKDMRNRCMSESLRVLKPNGILFTAYIPKFYICHLLPFSDKKYLDEKFLSQICGSGIMKHDDEKCFWTDAFFSSAEEMEELYHRNGLQIIYHFAQDGLTPMHSTEADSWTDDEFRIWCEHHYDVCREKSLLGMSNHVVIVGRKI